MNKEVDEKYKKEENIKKSIIRKKILQKRGKELDALNLTDEEKEFQLNRWVNEEYQRERLGYRGNSNRNHYNLDFEKV